MPHKPQTRRKRIIVKKTSGKKPGAKPIRRATSQKRGKLSPGRSAGTVKKVLGQAPLMVCTSCRAVYFDEHWHEPRFFDKSSTDAEHLRQGLCDACAAPVGVTGNAASGFAGEVVLEGFLHDSDKAELLSLVRHLSKTAAALDPTHRVTRIIDKGASVVVYTSENQLAASIGKHVDRARKGGTLEIHWSDEDKPVRVHWKGRTDLTEKP